MQILRAAEDYLEAMLMMQQKHGYIRSIDIAEHLGVTKPSVTYTTKRLRENGYITMDRDGLITLTPRGMDIAARMLDRHHTLTKFLMELGVDAKTAEEDACKMEHDISEQTYTALCRHASASSASSGRTMRVSARRPGPTRTEHASGQFRPRQLWLPRAVLLVGKARRAFPTKGLQAAARRLCTPGAHKVHTCSQRSIFSHAHVARENDCNALPPAGGKLCEAFLTRWAARGH